MTDNNSDNQQYYFQDELGSPIRLFDETGTLTDTYGYDEFGQDLYHNQGTIQPFGYTGYQQDTVAGAYYAQAREYRNEMGRFTAQDILPGNQVEPYTLNRYGYCWGNPMQLVDLDGRKPKFSNPLEWGEKMYDEFVEEQIAKVEDDNGITLSSAEKELIKKHPYQAYVVNECKKDADNMTDEIFSGKYQHVKGRKKKHWIDGDAANAYRHATWNALMAKKLGSKNAEKWASAHEKLSQEQLDSKWGTHGYTGQEHTDMDLHNNEEGRKAWEEVAKKGFWFWEDPDELISKQVMEKLKKGKLYVLVDEDWYDELLEDCDE